MSSGAVACGSRTVTTAATVQNEQSFSTRRPTSLCQVPTSVVGCSRLPSHWRSVHSARLDKITGQCLWNACKALAFGVILLLIGSTMAIIGYYADSMSMMEDERRGNVTIKVRNFSKQLHMLSYLGPCIMGLGGFVLVAACVMTFEARDSAAKIVPERFRANGHHHHHHHHQQQHQKPIDGEDFLGGGQELCVLTSNGTAVSHLVKSKLGSSWEHEVHRLSGGEVFDRLALTTAFIEFSHNIQKSIDSDNRERCHHPHQQQQQQQQQDGATALKQRCPSAPDLMPDQLADFCDWHSDIPKVFGVNVFPRVINRQESNVKRLQVNLLPRQAVSVDNPSDAHSPLGGHIGGANSSESDQAGGSSGVYRTPSDASMTMDLHLPDCPVTLTVKDEAKRSGDTTQASSAASSSSETSVGTPHRTGNRVSDVGRKESAKRHPLLRQRQVERHPDSDTEEDEAAEAAAAAESGRQAS